MLTMGVVGCGYWGPNLIRNFSALSDCRIMHACDSDASRLSHMKALYPPNSDGYGVRLRSGAAIVANNTFENVYYPVALVLENNNLGGNCTSAMGFPEDQEFGPGKDACTVNDGCCDKIEHVYVWGNTQTSYGLPSRSRMTRENSRRTGTIF